MHPGIIQLVIYLKLRQPELDQEWDPEWDPEWDHDLYTNTERLT